MHAEQLWRIQEIQCELAFTTGKPQPDGRRQADLLESACPRNLRLLFERDPGQFFRTLLLHGVETVRVES
jgi:hypothetical protein